MKNILQQKRLLHYVAMFFVFSIIIAQPSTAAAAGYWQYNDLESNSRIINYIIHNYVDSDKLLVSNVDAKQQSQEVVGRQNTILGQFKVENKQDKTVTLDAFGVSMLGEYTDALTAIRISDDFGNRIGNTITDPQRLNIVTDSVRILPHDDVVFTVYGDLASEKVVPSFSIDFTAANIFSVQDRVISNTVTGREIFVRQSKPTITLQSLPHPQLAEGIRTISKFTIHADQNGPVAIHQFAWAFDPTSNTGMTLLSPQLYEEIDPSNPITTLNAGISYAVNHIYITLDSEVVIPAGSSKTFILKAIVINVGDGDVLSTKLLGPSGFKYVVNGTAPQVRSDGSFIWSDMSAEDPHSIFSPDWTNSIDIHGLPTEKQYLFN